MTQQKTKSLDLNILNFNNFENLLLTTPFGQDLSHNEQIFYHNITRTIFGYYAIQIGLPQINFLQSNKISNKYTIPTQINCNLHSLPFATNSIDLIICPHALEFMPDYETLLQECYRILIPNGKLIITNFNKYSPLGLASLFKGLARHQNATDKLSTNITSLIPNMNLIGLSDMKKILAKLNFVLHGGKFFGYLPPINNTQTLLNLAWLDKIGDRWLPSCSNTYAILASKETATITPIKPKTQEQQLKSVPELSGV